MIIQHNFFSNCWKYIRVPWSCSTFPWWLNLKEICTHFWHAVRSKRTLKVSVNYNFVIVWKAHVTVNLVLLAKQKLVVNKLQTLACICKLPQLFIQSCNITLVVFLAPQRSVTRGASRQTLRRIPSEDWHQIARGDRKRWGWYKTLSFYKSAIEPCFNLQVGANYYLLFNVEQRSLCHKR